ncbi:MAG TPA: cupin domain-containing protein [Acidimicrobiia bacterium]|nr:cupin domain-containing protein [Acidimicrobiia bacterium]
MSEAFDFTTTYVHLGLGARVDPLPDFQWTPEYLAGYTQRTESDGDEGRLVVLMDQPASWESWERHPAGDELVVLLAGRVDLIQEIDGEPHVVELEPGMAVINPPGVWHTADVHQPGRALFITAGRGTEARPR